MKTITRTEEMHEAVLEEKSHGRSVGFVPTMGFLHEGHLSLVRESVRRADVTVVSIYVNPTQFGPKEDFKQYPRDIHRDTELLKAEGVDYLFLPDNKEIYPEGYKTYVEVHDLQDKLCGRSRPGHFRGVCTVALKLFNTVNPDMAFFGQKDAQQTIILKRMVQDLNLGVKIEVVPIVREEDGLALSSRNTYLNQKERSTALVLSASLEEARMMVKNGERDSGQIVDRMKEMIGREPLAKIDYVEIVDMENLDPVQKIENEAMAALAVFVGEVRLIDNTILQVKE
ncbi:MAG: pantoate--beta-alanine ligase [Candidatus Aminicenantes bacterium]|nr:MAG: pantoate--beta-alanine ligase [Candidatus Aminicenantes bacterium]